MPMFPPKLVALDLNYADSILRGTVEYIDAWARERLNVRWSVENAPSDYLEVCGGVAYVQNTEQVFIRPRSINARPDPLGDSRYRWIEGLSTNDPWLMFILILPKGHSITNPFPSPISAKVHQNRIALYWILKADEFGHAQVEWSINDFNGDLSAEVERINSARVKINVPLTATFNVDESQRSLRVFLCHSSNDKQRVRELYSRIGADGFNPWLDEEDLLPGQDWHKEITKAVRNSDVVIVCLSAGSINKRGYVQRELKYALDVADEQPEGTIFLIPLKLEECNVPEQLSRWHWVNFFEEKGYSRLLSALKARAKELGLDS